jgi:molybdopterin-binding protein
MTERLAVRGLSVVFGRREVLRVEALGVSAGEVLAVIGPNGAGKSTLVQALGLLLEPAAGQVFFDGEPVDGDRLRYRRRMAVVFQEPLLLDTTVEANVATGLALRGVRGEEQRRRVSEWLDRFGIAHLAKRSARTLSGGEAQRTSLARALVLEPEVLLLDEPFSALDAPARQALTDDLDGVLGATGIATVFVTHDRAEALRLGDRVGVLMGGRLRQAGPPEEVFAAPADEEVAAFVGIETIVPGRVLSVESGLASVDVAGHTVEAGAPPGVADQVLVCLRPEDIILSRRAGHERTSARNALPATVRRVLPSGHFVRVELDAGFPLVALITRQSLEELSLAPGAEVMASFKATAVHLIAHR